MSEARAGQAPSRQSHAGLDWMNFFMADVQTGFGSFVSFYLAGLGWSVADVGLVLTAGRIAGVIAQMPLGAVTDAVPAKRALVAIGALMLAVSALILALWPSFVLVFIAEVLHGITSGIIGPAIGAISLGLVGHRAMSGRVGRNHRFDAAGNALTAVLLGVIGRFASKSTIFIAAAALTIPTLYALSRIRGDEIDYARARNAADSRKPRDSQPFLHLLRNRRLLVFAGCLVLFQLADSSMLPVVSEAVGGAKGDSSLFMAGLVAAPQVVVAFLAPWIGHYAERWGRKPLLLVGLGVEPIRGALFAFITNSPWLIGVQVLDGISGAVITVLSVLVIADVTVGTGRFNFARGVYTALTGAGAAVSTTATGYLIQGFGHSAGFLAMAAVAALATGLLWAFLPETKPERYTH